MQLITKNQINNLINEGKLVITPILDSNQIGQSSVDLRIGTTFKIAKQTRLPLIDVEDKKIQKFFDQTYSNFGQDFILYPNQLVIGSTFEFIKLPNNIIAYVFTRSSFNRLGVQIASMVQPGYVGTLSLELINKGQNAIKLKTGMRIVQILLFDIKDKINAYPSLDGSKYIGNIEPQLSNIWDDYDLGILDSFTKNI